MSSIARPRAVRVCSSPPNSISIALTPDLGQVRSGRPRGAVEPDPRGILPDRRWPRGPSHGWKTSCRAHNKEIQKRRKRRQKRSSQKDRGNRQLRDFPRHQDRNDRRRARQPHLRRRSRRWHLHEKREGRDGLRPARQGRGRSHRGSGALGHRFRSKARRPGRGGQSAARRNAAEHHQRAQDLVRISCNSPKTTSCAASSSPSCCCSA